MKEIIGKLFLVVLVVFISILLLLIVCFFVFGGIAIIHASFRLIPVGQPFPNNGILETVFCILVRVIFFILGVIMVIFMAPGISMICISLWKCIISVFKE
jgi:hypothetical protein